jgi:hypothetical protein
MFIGAQFMYPHLLVSTGSFIRESTAMAVAAQITASIAIFGRGAACQCCSPDKEGLHQIIQLPQGSLFSSSVAMSIDEMEPYGVFVEVKG